MDSASSEANIERSCAEWVRSQGGVLIKIQRVGWPDREILKPPGLCAFVEFKRPGKALRPLQQYRLERVIKLGFQAYEVDNVKLFKQIYNSLA